MHVEVKDRDSLEELLEYSDAVIRESKKYANKHNLPPELRTPILDVKDRSKINGVQSRVAEVYGSEVHLYYRRHTEVHDTAAIIKDLKFESATIISQALEHECSGSPELLSLLQELCKSPKPKAMLDKCRKSYVEQ